MKTDIFVIISTTLFHKHLLTIFLNSLDTKKEIILLTISTTNPLRDFQNRYFKRKCLHLSGAAGYRSCSRDGESGSVDGHFGLNSRADVACTCHILTEFPGETLGAENICSRCQPASGRFTSSLAYTTRTCDARLRYQNRHSGRPCGHGRGSLWKPL